MTKMTRKKAVKEADKWFSIYIRNRDIKEYVLCPFCKKNYIDNCFHFFSRKVYATRWDENNAIGSCRGCNMLMEFSPYQFYKWFADNYGQFCLDLLNAKYNSKMVMKTDTIIAIAERYKRLSNGKN